MLIFAKWHLISLFIRIFHHFRDYVLEATDDSPGVGVSNVEVKYKDIEISRLMAGLT
jgi:hypothetical protein